MDRMTPPPNYYGAPFQGYNQSPGQQQPPSPSNSNFMNNTPPTPVNPNTLTPSSVSGLNNPYPMTNIESITVTQEQISIGWSYADIAHANRGRQVKLYCSFPDSSQWHDVVIEGKIQYASDDHVVIESNEMPSKFIMVMGVYINYMELFERPIVPTKKST